MFFNVITPYGNIDVACKKSTFKPTDSYREGALILYSNTWDDFGFKTTLSVGCFSGGAIVDIGRIKLLFSSYIKGIGNTVSSFSAYFLSAMYGGGLYEYEDVFVSIAEDEEIYRNIESLCGKDAAKSFMHFVHDYGYVVNSCEDYDIEEIASSEAFKISLLRGISLYEAIRPFAWIFNDQIDFSFDVNVESNGGAFDIRFDFKDDILPRHFNVVIGPNGTGKTRTVRSVWDFFERVHKGVSNSKTSDGAVFFRNLLFFSYSPFERYDDTMLFRGRMDERTFFGLYNEKGELDLCAPGAKVTQSLVRSILRDKTQLTRKGSDRRYDFIRDIIKDECSIAFDDFYIPVNDRMNVDDSYVFHCENIMYIASTVFAVMSHEDFSKCENIIDRSRETLLVKNGNVVKLSSGQRFFMYIIIGLIGYINENSLVVIDEPECHLHPTLEVHLVRAIGRFLKEFNSFCILATHSMIVAREIPAKRVHVLAKNEFGVHCLHPSIETFGARLTSICNDVFGDYKSIKPYQDWISKERYSNENVKEFDEVVKTLPIALRWEAEEING